MSKKSEDEKQQLRYEYGQLKFKLDFLETDLQDLKNDYDVLSIECEELRKKLETQSKTRTKIEAMIDKYTPKKGK